MPLHNATDTPLYRFSKMLTELRLPHHIADNDTMAIHWGNMYQESAHIHITPKIFLTICIERRYRTVDKDRSKNRYYCAINCLTEKSVAADDVAETLPLIPDYIQLEFSLQIPQNFQAVIKRFKRPSETEWSTGAVPQAIVQAALNYKDFKIFMAYLRDYVLAPANLTKLAPPVKSYDLA